MAIVFCVGVFVVNDQDIFQGGNSVTLSNEVSIISSGVYLLLYSAFIALVNRYCSVHRKPLFFFLFLAFFIVDIVAIWAFPGIYDTDQLIYQSTILERVRYSLYGFVCFSMLYLFFAIAPQMTNGSDFSDGVIAILVAVVLVSVLYSYIAEASLYQLFFTQGHPTDAYSVPKSWMGHRNIYAFFLFNGMVGEAYLESRNPHSWRWAIIVFLFLNQFFILSKTTVIIAAFFLVAFYLWHFIKTLRNHPKRNWITLGVLFSLTIAFMVVSALPANNTFWASRYLHSVTKLMFSSVVATMMDRVYVWSDVVRCVNVTVLTIMVGTGYGAWNKAIYAYLMGSPDLYYPVDSAWVTDLARGGILGVVLSAGLWLYTFYEIYRAIRRKEKFAYVALFYEIALLMRSFIESGDLANPDAFGTLFAMMLVLPILSSRYEKQDEATTRYQISLFQNPTQNSYPKIGFKRGRSFNKWFIASSLIALVLFEGFYLFSAQANLPTAGINYGVSGLLAVLFFPYLISCLRFLLRQKRIAGFVGFLLFVLAYFFLGLTLPYFAPDWLGAVIPIGVGAILVITSISIGAFKDVPGLAKTSLTYSGLALALALAGYFILPYVSISFIGVLAYLCLEVSAYFFVGAVIPSLGIFTTTPRRMDDLFLILLSRYALWRDRSYAKSLAKKEGSV